MGTPTRGARLGFLSEVVSIWGDRARSQPPGRETHSEAQEGCRETGGVGGFLAMSGRLGHEEAHTQCPAI